MRISRGSTLVLLMGLLVVASVAFGQQTPSCTIYVQPGESIQAAIDKAPDGARICLGARVWEENIIITKNLMFLSMEGNNTETLGSHSIIFQVTGVEGLTPAQRDDMVSAVVQVFENRISLAGLSGVQIRKVAPNSIEVLYLNILDVQTITALLERPGHLAFLKVVQAGTSPDEDLVPTSPTQEVLKNRDGIPYVVDSEPILTGAALSDARVRTSQSMQTAGQLYIAMTFNQQGAQQLVEALRRLKGDNPNTLQNEGDLLAVVLDNVIYSAPRITQSIKDAAAKGWRNVQNTTTISGKFTKEEASRIATVLRAGTPLPDGVGVNVIKLESSPPVICSTNAKQTVQIKAPEGVQSIVVSFKGLDLQGGILLEGQTKVKIINCILSGSNEPVAQTL